MGQETTPKTLAPDSDLGGGKVRPKSKVKIVFTNSKHHNVPNVVEAVHPALAKKLIESGKAREGSKLTETEKTANKAFLEETIKSKGRKPGKVKELDADDDGFDDDLVDEKSKDKQGGKDKGKPGAVK